MAKGTAIAGNDLLALQFPSKPAIELTKMNIAEIAEAVFVGAQWRIITTGVRKMPPPVPVSPERSPSPPPTTMASDFGGGCVWRSAGGRIMNRAAEKRRTRPTSQLKTSVGKFLKPP